MNKNRNIFNEKWNKNVCVFIYRYFLRVFMIDEYDLFILFEEGEKIVF